VQRLSAVPGEQARVGVDLARDVEASPPSTSRSSPAAIPSSTVDLPLPFSPTRNVTRGSMSTRSTSRSAGSSSL
jgi:hypothetical protein